MNHTLLEALTLSLDAMLTGTFLCSSLVEHSARNQDANHWAAYKQAKERVFGPVMPIYFMIGVLLTIGSAVMLDQHVPYGVASALMLLVLVITIRVHVPINNEIQTWQLSNVPTNFDVWRARWRNWNLARFVFVFIAFVIIVITQYSNR